ncbi:unnamed protein product [Blepharisma stoltei]|uniref:Uncharacterized protein n=1 Tax=Blepharisma stoltei TaxID=1481888 RepID=A0AAU9JXA1_9CILI|nr:unnamed protein product [Blepharisma stoltei]
MQYFSFPHPYWCRQFGWRRRLCLEVWIRGKTVEKVSTPMEVRNTSLKKHSDETLTSSRLRKQILRVAWFT